MMLGLDHRAARYTWTAAFVLLLLYVIYIIRGTLFIFTVSLLFAYLLYPLVDWLYGYLPRGSRAPALAIVYLVLMGLLVFAGVEFGSSAVEQAQSLSQRAPELLKKLQQQPSQVPLPQSVKSVKDMVLGSAESYLYKHYQEMASFIPKISLEVLKASSNLIFLVIIPILSFFILKDGREIRDNALEMVDNGPSRDLLAEIMGDIHELLLQYMRALFALCAITLVTFAIVLSLIGVPYAILLATIAFPLEFIPLVGPLIAAVIIISVVIFSGYPHVIWVILFLGLYRVCQDYVVSPRLMSAGVELHPLLVIFGVFAGGELGGVAGTFLSVPTLALLRILYRRVRRSRIRKPGEGSVVAV